LIGAIINGLLGAIIQKKMGKGAISFIACTPVVIAFGISLSVFFQLKGLNPEQRFLIDHLYSWITLGSLKVDMAFLADPLSTVMILVVTGIGGLIHIYAIGYMHDDKAFWRFFAYLNLFTAAMLTLVLGDSLLLMFVGWEGVGLCSYALIGFWYQDHNNARAGNKAFHRQSSRRLWLCLGHISVVLDSRRAGPWHLDFPRDSEVGVDPSRADDLGSAGRNSSDSISLRRRHR
jgi:NADH-quinone oxidoreductase subunit L